MAEVTISHFREFDIGRQIDFGEIVLRATGLVVYGKTPSEIASSDITVRSIMMAPGSHTAAPSGTELKVDLAEEAWPRNGNGKRLDVEVAIAKTRRISADLGVILRGGVDEIPGAEVFVWTRQFAATGFYAGSTGE